MEGLQVVKINNQDLPIMTYNGQRVVTFKDIDKVHERPEGTASRNFRKNRKYFIKGQDFFIINKKDVGTNFVVTYGFDKKAPFGTLLTEMGYLMVVKSFTDSLAWTVQRQLVNGYFKIKELTPRSIQPIQQQLPQLPQPQVYTLNTHIRAEISSMIDKKIEEKLIMQNESLKSGQEVITQHFSRASESITRQYIGLTQNPIIDPIRDLIKPLAELYQDHSNGYNCTFRKVYRTMGCDWKVRRSRYRNQKGNRNNPSNITLIQSNPKLLKLFVDTVNQMIEETKKCM